MLRGRPWQQLRQTQPQKVIPSELLWQVSVMEEVIFKGLQVFTSNGRLFKKYLLVFDRANKL